MFTAPIRKVFSTYREASVPTIMLKNRIEFLNVYEMRFLTFKFLTCYRDTYYFQEFQKNHQ